MRTSNRRHRTALLGRAPPFPSSFPRGGPSVRGRPVVVVGAGSWKLEAGGWQPGACMQRSPCMRIDAARLPLRGLDTSVNMARKGLTRQYTWRAGLTRRVSMAPRQASRPAPGFASRSDEPVEAGVLAGLKCHAQKTLNRTITSHTQHCCENL